VQARLAAWRLVFRTDIKLKFKVKLNQVSPQVAARRTSGTTGRQTAARPTNDQPPRPPSPSPPGASNAYALMPHIPASIGFTF